MSEAAAVIERCLHGMRVEDVDAEADAACVLDALTDAGFAVMRVGVAALGDSVSAAKED